MDFQAGPATPAEQLAAVKAYAMANYGKNWDIVVETMSDEDILDAIKGTKTRWGAVERINREAVKPIGEYRFEIMNA